MDFQALLAEEPRLRAESWGPELNPESAISFLGPKTRNPCVRKFAVFRLTQLSSKELELFLLQLVQALRYEDFEGVRNGLHSDLTEFCLRGKVLKRVKSCPDIRLKNANQATSVTSSNFFHGPALNRCNSVTVKKGFHKLNERFSCRRRNSSSNTVKWIHEISLGWDLSTFLVNKCCGTFRLANYFYWYLMAECESSHNSITVQEMYLLVLKRFLMKLEHGSQQLHTHFQLLQRQYRFVQHLAQTVQEVQSQSIPRPRKLKQLKERLVLPNDDIGSSFADFNAIPLPLDPEIMVDGIVPGRSEIFKSATLPCKLVFRRQTIPSDFYTVIFKVGNDLRQDQLAQQLIGLFNRILLDAGLDMGITPYKVLATSANSGFVEFVESRSIADITSEHGSILKYFCSLSGWSKKTHKSIVGNFTKSCAAYCIMTYLLGVGDRHLDNLLLTKEGNLFHVDFAFMLGQDPRPLPPPMKLTKEMIEAMGGSQSVSYQQFRQHCHVSYLVLRRNSDLILGLLSLMSGSCIPALQRPGALANLRDRLKLNLSDREAVKHVDNLLHISSSAVVASIVERLHKLAQAMRT